MPRLDPTPVPCSLCGRAFSVGQLTDHHCLPKSKGGTREDVERLCPQCHGMVHAAFTNDTLAAVYPTIGQLRRAPELAGFLKWVRKQAPSSRKRNKPRNHKV